MKAKSDRLLEVIMSSVRQLEEAITQLDKKEYTELRNWFVEYESEKWDNQIQADAGNGSLDFLKEEAIQDYSDNQIRRL